MYAQEYHTEMVSSSIIYSSGSTQFGNSADDRHLFQGLVSSSGGISASGDIYASGHISASGTITGNAISFCYEDARLYCTGKGIDVGGGKFGLRKNT